MIKYILYSIVYGIAFVLMYSDYRYNFEGWIFALTFVGSPLMIAVATQLEDPFFYLTGAIIFIPIMIYYCYKSEINESASLSVPTCISKETKP